MPPALQPVMRTVWRGIVTEMKVVGRILKTAVVRGIRFTLPPPNFLDMELGGEWPMKKSEQIRRSYSLAYKELLMFSYYH